MYGLKLNIAMLILRLKQFAITLGSTLSLVQAQNTSLTFGPSAFTAPGVFPTSAYSKYYNSPTATSAQVQPVISDPVLVCVASYKLLVLCLTNVP